jgi:hypothetical protein
MDRHLDCHLLDRTIVTFMSIWLIICLIVFLAAR